MRTVTFAAIAVAGVLALAGCGREPKFRATVVPAAEPTLRECVHLFQRQSGDQRDVARAACRDAEGKVWLRADIANVGSEAARASCGVQAFDATGRRILTTHLPMELLRYPVGPYIDAGGTLSFTTFIVDQPARPVDHYSATCEPVPEDVV